MKFFKQKIFCIVSYICKIEIYSLIMSKQLAIQFDVKRPIIAICSIFTVSLILKLIFYDPSIPVILDALNTFSFSTHIHAIGQLPGNYLDPKPLWPLFLSLFFSVFDFNQTQSYMQLQKILCILISCITIFPLYYLCKKFFSSKYSLVGILIFAVEPRLMENSLMGGTDQFFIFFIVMTLLTFFNKTKIFYLSFVFAGLATITRPEGVFLFFSIAIMLFFRLRGKKLFLSKYLISLLIFFIIILPLSIQAEQVPNTESVFSRIISSIDQFIPSDTKPTPSEISHNDIEFNKNTISILTGLEHFPKFLGWVMIPLFILVTPIGFFLFIKKLNPDKLTLIVTSVFLSIPAFYAYSYPLLETRYLCFLIPIFCIFAILPIKLFCEKMRRPNLVLLGIMLMIILISVLFISYQFDFQHEKESVKVAEIVIENTSSINEYYPESKYIKSLDISQNWLELNHYYKSALSNEEVISKMDHLPHKITRVDPISFENLPSFIDSARISHILVDGHENRPHYLNDVFLNEKEYPYLTKIYDSQDDNLMYHVKIFEIDYEKFIPSR